MLWAYFHYYQLFLDNTEITAPPTSSQAIVVYQAANNRIMQANQAAREAGITLGMGLAQAGALCPQLTILDYQQADETHRLTALANRLYQLVADIVLLPPNGLAVRLDPSMKYYGGLSYLWQALKNEMTAAHVHFSYATGWSVEAAKVLALNGANQVFQHNSAIKQALAKCPLEHTDLTQQQCFALHRVGIRDIATLLQMPVTELGKRFDNSLIQYLCALRAEVVPRYVYYHPESHFFSSLTPSYEISENTRLLPWMAQLMEEFMTYARLRNKLSACLAFELQFRDEQALSVCIQSATPLYKSAQWHSLMLLKLETLTLPAPVIQLSLTVSELEELEEQTTDFFTNRVHVFAQKQLLSRLQTRLGCEAVGAPINGNDHRLDQHQSALSAPGALPAYTLPSICLSQLQPLCAASHIEHGPIRLHTGWWDGNIQKRDYYIARASDGRRMHVFKDAEGNWFVQGWYC